MLKMQSIIDPDPLARAKITADLVKSFASGDRSIRELLSNREKPLQVLEVGCGGTGAYIVAALARYFGETNYNYLGVDNSERDIAYATAYFANDARTNVHFKCLDATKPDNLPDLEPGAIDLVILRHPNIMEQTKTFEEIFCEFVPTFLKSDGVLFVSTFFKPEMDTLQSQRFMTSFGLESFPAKRQERDLPLVMVPAFGIDARYEMDKFVAFGRVPLSKRLQRIQRKALHDYQIARFLKPASTSSQNERAGAGAAAGQVPEAAAAVIPDPSASWLSEFARDHGLKNEKPAAGDYEKVYNPSSSR